MSLRPRLETALAYLRSAPVSSVYLLGLLLTTAVQQTSSAHAVARLLAEQSTNLYHLGRDPIRVLVASAFWLSTTWQFFGWAAALLLLVAPVERRISGRRTVAVLAIGHVGATLVTAAGLWLALHADAVEKSVAHAQDIGPSYAVFAAAACFTFFLDRRLRIPYLAVLAGYGLAMVVVSTTFTDFGHLLAIGLGLASYPLVRRAAAHAAPVGTRLALLVARQVEGAGRSLSPTRSQRRRSQPPPARRPTRPC
jgi:hypothetical protein